MDAKTKKILIGVCVVGFVLTSTFTWGIFSAGIDHMQSGVEGARIGVKWTVAWVLAHANLIVPVAFLGVVVWLARLKTKG